MVGILLIDLFVVLINLLCDVISDYFFLFFVKKKK